MADLQHVTGLSECLGKLRALPVKLRTQQLKGATLDAAAVIRDEARTEAPYYHGDVQEGHPPPGTLKKSIIMKAIPEKSDGSRVTVYVTVKKVRASTKDLISGKRKDLVDPYYWWWVEFGTSKMEGRHYMTRSFQLRAGYAVDVFAHAIRLETLV